ncbi:MAG: ABC transporter permease subunit [Candidatus Aminicenantes bacterium]|nr:ABC transporter permease subunit [Candidatus Aminicenantes bacterium]
MTIREKGYSHWDGKLEERRFPWWPISRLGIRLAFKKKYFRLLLFGALAVVFVFIVGIYISERIEDFRHMIKDEGQLLKIDPAFFYTYLSNNFMLFMMVMIALVGGAGLIADDLKHNSLQLYFARPLKKIDYLLGKANVLVFFFLLITLVPGLVFVFFKLLFAGNFEFLKTYPWLPVSVIGYSLFITGFFCLYALLLSSLSKNSRYVSILIVAVYYFSDILFQFFFENVKKDPEFGLLSLRVNLQQVGAWFFNLKPKYAVPWYLSLLILLAVEAVGAVVLSRKVRGVEVVR